MPAACTATLSRLLHPSLCLHLPTPHAPPNLRPKRITRVAIANITIV